MDCSHGRQESLATFLARVKPGDSCACCGAALRSLDRGGKTTRSTSTVGGRHVPSTVIVCPACGCEISEEAGPDAEEAWSELSPAA
jgi:hypothetical protein